ncbi:uncharacterized protein LOC124173333 [Ischnura elegans]|uniref:uncharacterized protein LOC124173333 n=1 Tax=Ischnura elegans TaxID=197161 RepID=UPI001ED8A847|nr:uncharacterized protein LOC124173333 [Ischnura elegans]
MSTLHQGGANQPWMKMLRNMLLLKRRFRWWKKGKLGDPSAVMDIVFVDDDARPASAPPMAMAEARGSVSHSTPASSGEGTKRKASTPDDTNVFLKSAAEAIGSLSTKFQPKDGDTNFGELVACKLRGVSDKGKKNKIMIEILQVFTDNKE